MTLQELISIYRERHQLSLEEVGDAVGVSKSTVSRWESGAIRRISDEKKARLSGVFGIDVQDYLDHHFFRPIMGEVRAGYDLLAHETILGYEEVSKQEYDQGHYFLRVKGDSMIGLRIHDGDLVYVQKTNAIQSKDIAVVLLGDEEATVKKVIYKDDLLILESANPRYETRYYTQDEVESLPIRIIGKVLYSRIQF